MLYTLESRRVQLRGRHHFVAANATVIGSVVLEDESSVWFNTVIRGDSDTITIGARSNVQDASVLHTDAGIPLTLGAEVSVGHQAMLHGCTIGDGSLVGIKALILNHAVIGRECLIGANALVTEHEVIPDRSLVLGSPGKVVRTLSDDEAAGLRAIAAHYVANARRYLSQLAADAGAAARVESADGRTGI
ncbi:MAG TPA: gamma carbonic anhydrase family protein [Casimicrobiaceae bacterium]|nr:gamma carbonic anhydrase family protein [Casimicrobiaceae bacterium]